MTPRLRLEQETWTDVIEGDPFQELLIAATSVSITYALLRPQELHHILLVHPILILVGFALAFQRIRLARQIERMTSRVWDAVTPFYRRGQRILDHILDWPYLGTLYVLPFTAFSGTLMLSTYLILSATTLAHQAMFVQALRQYHSFHRYSEAERRGCEVRRFIGSRLVVLALEVALSAGALVAIALLGTSGNIGIWVAGVATLALMVVSGIVPYVLSTDAFTLSGLSDISCDRLDAPTPEDRSDITAIYENAFPSAERIGTAAEILRSQGTDGRDIHVARFHGRIVGFTEFQVRSEGVAHLRWIAVDRHWRGRRVGRQLIASVVGALPPDVGALIAEVRSDGSMAGARARFYRKLGSTLLTDLGYSVAASDGTIRVPYDLALIPTGGRRPENDAIVNAVLELEDEPTRREALRRRLLDRQTLM